MEKTTTVTRYKEKSANTTRGVVCVALCAARVAVSVLTFCVLCTGI